MLSDGFTVTYKDYPWFLRNSVVIAKLGICWFTLDQATKAQRGVDI